MLTPNQILSYTNSATLTKNILTEYYQHEILDSLFRQKGSENYSFIGGTAIRIAYGGERYSLDLDFDTTHLADFDDLMRDTLAEMTAKGFEIESRLVHKGAYHCYLRFPHVLKSLGLSGYSEEKLLIKVDAAPAKTLMTTSRLINKYGVFQTIKVAPLDVLLAKKLLAIMSRRRPKGRDLYDITFLWGLNDPSEQYLHSVGKTTLSKLLSEISQFVKKLDLGIMTREVTPFLINSRDADRVLHFDQFIASRIDHDK